MGSERLAFVLATAVALLLSGPAKAADEACKREMSQRIKICGEECRGRAVAATDIGDPNNNILFGCIKKCAQDMTLQRQVCQ